MHSHRKRGRGILVSCTTVQTLVLLACSLLAARLCGEAKPGQVLIPRRLLATVEDLVEAEPVGELSLKGFHRPVTGYNLLRLKE